MVEWGLIGEAEETQRPASMTLYSLPILHKVTWDYTKDFTMRNHHLTLQTEAI
jgi:hypothetical protein